MANFGNPASGLKQSDIDKAIIGEDLQPYLKGEVERFGVLPTDALQDDIYKCLSRNSTFFGRPAGYYQALVNNPIRDLDPLGWKKVSSASLPVYDVANDKDKYQQFTVNDLESIAVIGSDIGTTVQGYDANTTIQGNTFNGANQLVQLDGTAKLPAIDGSELLNLPSGSSTLVDLTDTTITTPADDEYVGFDSTSGKWINKVISLSSTSNVLMPNCSYDEVVTTKRWVDGRPIYRKYFTHTFGTTAVDSTIATGLTGIEQCTVSETKFYQAGGLTYSGASSFYISDASEFLSWSDKAGTTIYLQIGDGGAAFNNGEMIVAIEYTKTADTVNTPVHQVGISTTSNILMSGYDTTETLTEKRWTDGKPLYRKTITGSFTASDILNQATGITNASNCKVIELVGFDASGVSFSGAGNFYVSDVGEFRAYTLEDGTVFTINHSGTAFNGGSYYITFEYTKTTDTALSPAATISADVAIADAKDTNITSPAEGDALTYDLATGKWINSIASGGGDFTVTDTPSFFADGTTNSNAAGRTGDYLITIGEDVNNGYGATYDSVLIGHGIAKHTAQVRQTIAIGTQCGTNSGNNNVFIGYRSAFAAGTVGYTSSGNVCIGSNSGGDLTSGTNNTFIGNGAAANITTGYKNVVIGQGAGNALTNDTANTFVGQGAGTSSFGQRNTCLGAEAMLLNGNYNDNVVLGETAGNVMENATSATAMTNNIIIGVDARASGDNQIQIGNYTTTDAFLPTGVAWVTRSDSRDKADVRDTVLGLDFIKSIRAVDFKWDRRIDYQSESVDADGNRVVTQEVSDGSKKKTRYHHGIIAQELESLISATGVDFGGFKDQTINGGNDIKSVDYTEFIGPLIKAVQELSAKVELQQLEIDALYAGA